MSLENFIGSCARTLPHHTFGCAVGGVRALFLLPRAPTPTPKHPAVCLRAVRFLFAIQSRFQQFLRGSATSVVEVCFLGVGMFYSLLADLLLFTTLWFAIPSLSTGLLNRRQRSEHGCVVKGTKCPHYRLPGGHSFSRLGLSCVLRLPLMKESGVRALSGFFLRYNTHVAKCFPSNCRRRCVQ